MPWPLYEAEGVGATGAAVVEGAAAGGTPDGAGGGVEDKGGAFVFDAEKAFADLDTDTREWLQKGDYGKDVKLLAKKAHEQEKLIGNAVRIPGKDATPEEREEFLTKLGRPKTADEYQLAAPTNLPEGLPYDGELAKAFKGKAHELGLTAQQAAGLHEMFVEYNVGAFNGAAVKSQEQLVQKATAATEQITKAWGPLDGDTAKANFEIGDRVFTMAPGGQEVLEELKGLGLIGPNKEILSWPLAKMFSAIGSALYSEGGLLRGNPDEAGNPFADNSSNLTLQMKIVKENPDRARSLIAAAGKKPSDFGLTG